MKPSAPPSRNSRRDEGIVLILVSGATKTVEVFASNPRIGQLIIPAAGNRVRGILAEAAERLGWDIPSFLGCLGLSDRYFPGDLTPKDWAFLNRITEGQAEHLLSLIGIWE